MPSPGQEPNDRTHLSIGEVLELLVTEFPDVTISKIRFLESKGLIHTERTPSGYRKFYADDVERLRWILRQQRENFLPLKVIKGRLDNGVGASEPPLFDEIPDESGPELNGHSLDRAAAAATAAGSEFAARTDGEVAPTPR